MDINTFLREHGLRPDTWPMFADPAIWRFFGEGLRETLLMSVVSVALYEQQLGKQAKYAGKGALKALA